MVDSHRSDDSCAITCGVRPFREAGNGVAVKVHADCAVVRLHAGSEGGAACSGISHQGVPGHGCDEITHRELGEVDYLRAVTCGFVVLLRTHHLIDAHSVTDEIEHVFYLLLRTAAKRKRRKKD